MSGFANLLIGAPAETPTDLARDAALHKDPGAELDFADELASALTEQGEERFDQPGSGSFQPGAAEPVPSALDAPLAAAVDVILAGTGTAPAAAPSADPHRADPPPQDLRTADAHGTDPMLPHGAPATALKPSALGDSGAEGSMSRPAANARELDLPRPTLSLAKDVSGARSSSSTSVSPTARHRTPESSAPGSGSVGTRSATAATDSPSSSASPTALVDARPLLARAFDVPSPSDVPTRSVLPALGGELVAGEANAPAGSVFAPVDAAVRVDSSDASRNESTDAALADLPPASASVRPSREVSAPAAAPLPSGTPAFAASHETSVRFETDEAAVAPELVSLTDRASRVRPEEGAPMSPRPSVAATPELPAPNGPTASRDGHTSDGDASEPLLRSASPPERAQVARPDSAAAERAAVGIIQDALARHGMRVVASDVVIHPRAQEARAVSTAEVAEAPTDTGEPFVQPGPARPARGNGDATASFGGEADRRSLLTAEDPKSSSGARTERLLRAASRRDESAPSVEPTSARGQSDTSVRRLVDIPSRGLVDTPSRQPSSAPVSSPVESTSVSSTASSEALGIASPVSAAGGKALGAVATTSVPVARGHEGALESLETGARPSRPAGTSQVTLRLSAREDTASLTDSVRAVLRVQGSQVHARFVAETAEMDSRLRESLPELRHMLAQRGLEPSSVDVVSPSDPDARGGRQSRQGESSRERDPQTQADDVGFDDLRRSFLEELETVEAPA